MKAGTTPALIDFDAAPASHVAAVGEACVDEIAHLPADEAGAALAHALHWKAIDLELTAGGEHAVKFYEAVEQHCRTNRERLLGYLAKDPTPEVSPAE